MENGILITRHEGYLYSARIEKGEFAQFQLQKEGAKQLLGNIYLGKVQNIVKNIRAAFVEIEAGMVCYLPLTEKMPPICAKGVAAKTGNIAVGDEILVQVATERIKSKPPTLTTYLSLTGRHLVLTRGKTQISLSTKIQGKELREQLKEAMEEFKNEEYGFIIRTNAANVKPEVLREEAKRLIADYELVKQQGIHQNRFSLVLEAPKGYLAEVRDGYEGVVEQILTDDEKVYESIKDYLEKYQKEDLDKLEFYQEEGVSLAALYNLSAGIKRVTAKKVWLKSGAGIVIEPTESLTAIDVNTGKAIKGRKNVEETFFKINCEAAVEIAKQLRLRNLSGIILIDFIDMKDKEKQQELMELLRREVEKDPAKTIVMDMTALGLVEVTRKRLRQPLHEVLGKSE